ncbi:pyridoxal phosphate-dependent aminotransferase [Patescibacteria group bacterium]|nr:pyridoxal phosphate-dependent aminotransferase [Patescibacteria group bacterium]
MKQRSAIAASGHKFRTKNISKRAQKIVISPIKEMSIIADNFQEETGADIVSFGQGIPYFDTPKYIKKGIREALKEISTAKYTLEPGITELRKLLAKDLFLSKNIANIHPKKELMVAAGCQEAVACALLSIIDVSDEVLLFSPGFASHIEQVIQFGGIPKFAPLIEKEGWRLDTDELEKRVSKKTKAILFSNPSNPTGAVLSKKEIEGLVRIAKKYDLIIIADETYDFLVYDGKKHFSPASLKEVRDRVILCGSFSKKYALTGYRVGYAFADSGIIDHMLKVHDALTICAPAISQKAALAGLRNQKRSKSWLKEYLKKMTENRDLMLKELNQLKDLFEYQKPEGAYYILARYKIPNINSFEFALNLLEEAKVITIPGAAFGPTGEGHLRFSFACEPTEIKEGFRRIKSWFKNFIRNSYIRRN